MSEPLIVSEGKLKIHLQVQEKTLCNEFPADTRANLISDWEVVPMIAGLGGEGCEFTSRNRGSGVWLAPLLHIQNGLWAWLGFREEWEAENPAGSTRRFSFRSAGLTIHFGFRNTLPKPQIFRAEWAGWSRWNGYSYGHQAGNAAHPHWQFDAVESLQRDDVGDKAAIFLSVLKSESKETSAREFTPHSINDDEISDVVGAQKISRIHFASAAVWWKGQPNGTHVHVPSSPQDIQLWVKEMLKYVCQELARL